MLGGIHRRHDVAGVLQEAGTLRGERDAARQALEEGDARVLLQLLDRRGDGRLRDVELDRRLAHLPGIRRGDEIADLFEGQRHI